MLVCTLEQRKPKSEEEDRAAEYEKGYELGAHRGSRSDIDLGRGNTSWNRRITRRLVVLRGIRLDCDCPYSSALRYIDDDDRKGKESKKSTSTRPGIGANEEPIGRKPRGKKTSSRILNSSSILF